MERNHHQSGAVAGLLVAAFGLSLLGSGCVAVGLGTAYGVSDHGPSGTQKELIAEELAPYRTRGESAVSGRVFLETPSGPFPGGGVQVHLTPATSFSKAAVEQTVIIDNKMLDRRAEDVWWTTRADSEGRFVFSWLPAGQYFVLCPMAWSPAGGTDAKQAIAFALVTVAERENVRVDVKRTVGS